MIPQVVAKYTSSLSTGISKTSTSMTLSSTITRKGETVPTGFYGFVIDRGQQNEEVCTGTYNEGVVTFVLRGLSDLDGSTSVEENKFAHDKGAIVEITAHPALSVMLKTFDTFIDTYQGHWEGAVPTYADLPTGTNDGEVRVTLDDSKIYIWDAETSAWILGGSGGGAGTVYRTTLLGTESTGDDNKTFTLTSGSFPDKKYFQVYKNGVLMVEGATNDYVATGSNQAVFNEAVLDDDVIDLLVISVDLYNPAWNQVNDDILPDTDNTYDIGSSSKQFKDAYIKGLATFGEIPVIPTTAPTTAGQVIALDSNTKLPAVDGSNLTGMSGEYISSDAGTEVSATNRTYTMPVAAQTAILNINFKADGDRTYPIVCQITLKRSGITSQTVRCTAANYNESVTATLSGNTITLTGSGSNTPSFGTSTAYYYR